MNSLVIQQNDLQVLQTIASTAAKSGLYGGVGGQEKILMILLAAQDLGIKPTIALNGGIWNIQGKIEISARLMTSMIRRAGHSISIKECNDKVCTLKGKRADNGDEIECTFGIEDAQKAGLAGRDVWKKYAEDMLYARAMSRLARRLFPDVIGTAYVEGEIRDAPKDEIKPEDMAPEHVEITDVPNMKKDEPVIHLDPFEMGKPIEGCLFQGQVDLILKLTQECDVAYVGKLKRHLLDLGYLDYYHIPQGEYEKIINGITKNVELVKKRKEQG